MIEEEQGTEGIILTRDGYERCERKLTQGTGSGRVEHPKHYAWLKDKCGVEVIDIARHLDFDLGNALKYILRAGRKQEGGLTEKQKTIEDLKKAAWYINDKIKSMKD